MIKKLILILLISSCALLAPNSREDIKKWRALPLEVQLQPFSSDGCSMSPDGTPDEPNKWLKCCVLHDIKYWVGGSEDERLSADHDLKMCLHEEGAIIADSLYYIGVRIGGRPYYYTSYRWGYGWKYDRGYIPLDNQEKEYIKKHGPQKGDNLIQYLNSSNFEVFKELKIPFPGFNF